MTYVQRLIQSVINARQKELEKQTEDLIFIIEFVYMATRMGKDLERWVKLRRQVKKAFKDSSLYVRQTVKDNVCTHVLDKFKIRS